MEFRFVQTPSREVMDRLTAESGELKSDISSLEKKLHYLETTYKNSKENLEQILNSAGGSS
jgi:prefoldin subunit 1